MLDNRKDCRYLSFNQIKKAGGKLKKGSKATRLIAWKITKKIDPVTGKDKIIPFIKDVCVFNVEDCDDLEIKPINEKVFDESIKPNQKVEDITKKHNIKIINEATNQACYNPMLDSITIPLSSQFSSQDAHSGTLIHEIVHWSARRVDRDCSKYSFDIEERALEELVAELGSMFICKTLGINGYMDKNNLAYIKSWKSAAKGKNGDRFIYKACSLAEKACKFLIGDLLESKTESTEILSEVAE
jgi:antirestriction protein ArdC